MTRQKIKHAIKDFLANRNGNPAIALISDNDSLTSMMCSIAAEINQCILILPPGDNKIAYKRMLNNCGAQLLIYTTSYEDTVWEILNDGTTAVVETLKI